jgi:hypothetical protein
MLGLTWRSVERKPGYGIELESHDGFWTIRYIPEMNLEPVLYRNIDGERTWARDVGFAGIERLMAVAQAQVHEDDERDRTRGWS